MPLPLTLPPPDPGLEMLISSQGMSQGLPITDGIQLFPRLTVRLGKVQAGVQWRNVDSPAASGVAAVFGRYDRKLAGWQANLTVRYRMRTGFTGIGKADSWEFSVSGRRSVGRGTILINVDYSPEEFGRGQSLYAELTPSLAVGAVRISGAVGRRFRKIEPYTGANVGISRTINKAITVDARLSATDRSDLGGRYKPRVVVSARVTL